MKSTISKYYITAKLDGITEGGKTEIRHRVLIQVYVCELHIYMLNKYDTGFPCHMMKDDLSVLVILFFNYFLRLNYKIQHSIIKLFVVVKYASNPEHTKNHLIIGVSKD